MYVQMTSSDVADSLDLETGQYKYTERRQVISAESCATETGPGVNTADDSSRYVQAELDKSSTVLPASGQGKETDSVIDDASNTSQDRQMDEAYSNDTKKLASSDMRRDDEDNDDSSNCGVCTGIDVQSATIMTGSEQSGQEADQVVSVESHTGEHLNSDGCISTNLTESTVVSNDADPNEIVLKF